VATVTVDNGAQGLGGDDVEVPKQEGKVVLKGQGNLLVRRRAAVEAGRAG
jgi:hypothetical protein